MIRKCKFFSFFVKSLNKPLNPFILGKIINLNLESSFFKSFPPYAKKFAKCKHSGSVLEGLGSRCLSPQNPRYLRNPQISQIPVEI